MSPIAALSARRILVFDTGPLWELVLYNAVHGPLGFASLRGELLHLLDHSSYQRLSKFIGDFQRKVTTPHVVAEISSRITRMKEEKGKAAVWGLVYNEFSSMGMDENVMRLLDMPQDLVAKIGAVDVSILELGRSFTSPRPLILSIDKILIAECNRAGLSSMHLWEVIADTV
jgi:hypothetical protein